MYSSQMYILTTAIYSVVVVFILPMRDGTYSQTGITPGLTTLCGIWNGTLDIKHQLLEKKGRNFTR